MESNQNSTPSEYTLGKGQLFLVKDGINIPLCRCIDFKISVAKIGEKLSDLSIATNKAALRFSNFNDYYINTVGSMYRKKHGRLPGSLRTKRLRKKRLSILREWFVNEEIDS